MTTHEENGADTGTPDAHGTAGGTVRAGVSRRQVLGWSALAAVGAGLSVTGANEFLAAVRTAATGKSSVFQVGLVRAEDQINLQFSLYNFTLLKVGEAGAGDIRTARLVITDPAAPGFMVVHFPPQHVAERAYVLVDPARPGQGGDESNSLATPVPAALSRTSSLAFRVPGDAGPIPFTAEALLRWDGFTQSVVPAAMRTVPGKPGPKLPELQETKIELPWGLVLSPHDGAGWAHSVTPVTHGQRTELWHTRLGERRTKPDGKVEIDENSPLSRKVRAVWTQGYDPAVPNPAQPDPPGRTSLTAAQRYEIVRLSSDHSLVKSDGKAYEPQPIAVNRLMLSPLGGWLDAEGRWERGVRPQGASGEFSMEQWKHQATMGRDHYVKVVQSGFLYPFGHRASLVTVTERMFQKITAPADPSRGKLAAFNRQRTFLVVREPVKTFGQSLGREPHLGKAMPFRAIRILTESTPNLAEFRSPGALLDTRILRGNGGHLDDYYAEQAFWPVVPTALGPQVFSFVIEAQDWAGRVSRFTAPLIFVLNTVSDDLATIDSITRQYNAEQGRRERPMSGQSITLTGFGESTYSVESMTLSAAPPSPMNAPLDRDTQPRFFPVLTQAKVRLDAVERISGKAPSTAGTVIEWHKSFLNGLPNPGQVFAKLVTPVGLEFAADAVGAMITPNMQISGLSSLLGPVGGDLTTSVPLEFDPTKFFAGALPMILGTLPLPDIIAKAAFTAVEQVPRLVKKELPDAVETSMVWKPAVKADARNVFEPKDTQNGLEVRVRTRIRRSGGTPTYEVVGELRNFAINAVGTGDWGLLTINFRSLRFSARDGHNPTVDVDIADVRFRGVLEFLNPLQKFLASLPLPATAAKAAAPGKALAAAPAPNGPFVDVTTQGVRAGYTLSLPKIAVGVFSLENVAVSAILNLPFIDGPARVRFAFCDRERPFSLSIAIFGGGGFCALELGLDGFERFEAALEFGAKFSLDLGVASGGVSATAGMYFGMTKDQAELTGYVRINGRLRVLGLVSVSTDFYLGLSYNTGSGELVGRAKLKVSVDVAFFSTSVTLGPIEKRFAGGKRSTLAGAARSAKALAPVGPPGVADMLSKADWDDPASGYCAMFAPAAFA